MTKILIVDDEPSMRELLVAFLTKIGVIPFTASNGQEALEKINIENPTLVISDLKMPLMDGFELLAKVSTAKNPVPVIIITGTEIPPDDFGFLQSRKAFRGIIKKPFDFQKLRSEIESCLSS